MKTKLFFVCQRKRNEYSARNKNRCRYTTIAADKYRLFHFFVNFISLFYVCVSVIAIVLVIAAFGLDYYFLCVCLCVLLQLCPFVAIIHIRLLCPLAEFRLH